MTTNSRLSSLMELELTKETDASPSKNANEKKDLKMK